MQDYCQRVDRLQSYPAQNMVELDDDRDIKRARTAAEASGEDEPMADADANTDDNDNYAKVPVQQLMKQYYGQVFPVEEFCTWLAYGNDSKHTQADPGFFQRRELCFTLDGDIFVRYQSFKDAEDLQRGLLRKLPAKIDIGPVYTVDPQRRNAYAGADKVATSDRVFLPLERELVFDIDLTDYDEVRTCGKEGHICRKCWPLMAVAVEVLDKGLRDDFGFKHILWVFSGRRGIHCWVCDRKARLLTDEQRSALANYFSIYKGSENGLAKLMLPFSGTTHPCVDRAVAIIKDAWTEKLLPEQGLLDNAERWQSVLRFFGDDDIATRLDSRWAAQASGVRSSDINAPRWAELEAEVLKVARQKDVRRAQKVQRAMKEILLAYAYPRLDVEVSKKMNHLLKAPFCVHPKTGKVCVPMDPEEIWDFDPEEVPTVQQLLREADAGPKATGVGKAKWDQTALAPCMRFFNSQFLQPLQVDCQKALNEKARAAAAKSTLAW